MRCITDFISNSTLKKINKDFLCAAKMEDEIRKIYPIKYFFAVIGDLLTRCAIFQISEKDFLLYPIENIDIPLNFKNSFSVFLDNIVKIDDHYLFPVKDSSNFIYFITFPYIKLISLFHKDNFPLPRFPLGISDIAGAIRSNFVGRVDLCDMQFDKSIKIIIDEINAEKPEIIGISATFGQQDLIDDLLDQISILPGYNPLIILGGSLSTLNSDLILNNFPYALISKGYGETTMKDLVAFWHGQIEKQSVNFISYKEGDKTITTVKKKDDKNTYIVPELDLLEDTLAFNGVMQLESSRGCTYHCSFCPRAHKGAWSGDAAQDIEQILPFIRLVFDQYPKINPKIFLVDEEFIGYNTIEDDVHKRALHIGKLLSINGFKFESSTRVDQVYKPLKVAEDKVKQIKKINFWKNLLATGLDRMLFGVESGVDSILKRFDKQSTCLQNVIAVRILTTIGVPLRLTYITFDPLMSMEELILSYKFQGRKDIILKPNNSLSEEQILDCVSNDSYVEEHTTNAELFTEISYMLVSMESLIGSKYLRLVEEEGLAEEHVFSMGKRSAHYRNPDIGIISTSAQKWVDRNFSLDYLLKSIIKFSNAFVRQSIVQLRRKIKRFSYTLLGKMLSVANNDLRLLHEPDKAEIQQVANLALQWRNADLAIRNTLFVDLLSDHFDSLVEEFLIELRSLRTVISDEEYLLIDKQVALWLNKHNWELINSK
ncbi:radical SAM protein [Pedobacter sp. L105]|uniref:B12-binding domain-containing radical SAM protein n=1 Tax=Pedobacter sp. L105 TaxID=1641871 RepID=UPI00131D7855|nr:cobalamin-dependent protein [Pedobacter sp. L105]